MDLRNAVTGDADLLTSLVVEAVNWTGKTRMTREQVMAQPELSHYVAGWKRPTDFGLVAMTDDGAPLGAIWWRYFPDDEPGYGFIARDIPELSMAVLPSGRGHGVGRTLLRACIDHARTAGCSALSLSVADGNDTARGITSASSAASEHLARCASTCPHRRHETTPPSPTASCVGSGLRRRASSHSSGRAAKASLVSRYQSIDFLGWRQRPFMASRDAW